MNNPFSRFFAFFGSEKGFAWRRRVALPLFLIIAAGFILIFEPRMPRKLEFSVEFSDDLQTRVSMLYVKVYQKGEVIKSFENYYQSGNAPKSQPLSVSPHKGEVEITATAFADRDKANLIASKSYRLNFEGGEKYTFYLAERTN